MTAPHVVTPADLPAPYAGPPLRLAWIGNQRHPWCSEVHFTKSMESLGHSVTFFQEDETDWTKLPAYVEHHGIQAVFWTRTWPQEMSVVAPVLDEFRKLGVVSGSVHLDRWFGLDRAHQVDDQPFFRTDVVFSPDNNPQWAEHGVNHFWLPPGVYGPECESVPPNPRRWPYDVVFVGSHPYPHLEWQKYRSDLLSAFSKAFRGRFGILPRRGVPIRGRDLQELYATVPVVIGDSCLAGESFQYWSDRVPETLGRGGFLIHPVVDGMDEWYAGGPIPGTVADPIPHFGGYRLGEFGMAEAIAQWALRSSDQVAVIRREARATVLARDTYAHRMGTVLAVAEGIHGEYRDAPEGKTYSYDVDVTTGKWSNPVLVNQPGFPVFTKTDPDPSTVDATQLEDAVREYERLTASAFTPTPLRVKLHRWSAVFEPRPGTTDAEVCEEVWGRNDYRVPPEGFRGTVVDIGANCGAFSVLAAKAGSPVVYAVEPEVSNRERLHRHLSLNGAGNVRVWPWAVTDGATETVVMRGTGGGARSVVEDWIEADQQHVPVLTLPMLLSTTGPVEFLKMDIEGGEYLAFAACPVEVLAQIERIALEFHGPGMPHLSHLDDDDKHLERWGALVAKLADAGRVETFGHPMRGGLIWWKRYSA